MNQTNKIREVRERVGVTQMELAKLAHISQPYLSDLEKNHRGAKPETLERIASGLGVTVMELTGKELV